MENSNTKFEIYQNFYENDGWPKDEIIFCNGNILNEKDYNAWKCIKEREDARKITAIYNLLAPNLVKEPKKKEIADKTTQDYLKDTGMKNSNKKVSSSMYDFLPEGGVEEGYKNHLPSGDLF